MMTIDIVGKEWFDKINGNSYFSCRAIIDYGLPTERAVYIPYQYGYGDCYIYEAFRGLQKIDHDTPENLHDALERGIIVRYGIQTGCLKRDVTAWGNPNK